LPATDTLNDRALQTERLVRAVREAGAIALKAFCGTIRSWTKAHDSPVSEIDIAVDDLLRQRLTDPGIGWLSEESKDDLARLKATRVFIVDPIDGTRAYLAGKPDWSISAALVENGRPVAAVVFAPVEDEMFVATAGAGATRNGIPIAAADGEVRGARIAGPKSYLNNLAAAAPGIVALPKIHSLALRLTRVAQGAIDAAFASVNGRDWDLAAADLLVHEAGGAMTSIAGQPLVYNLHDPVHGALLAAGPVRHQALLGLVRTRRNEFN
jgi:myo-inositol-1(or 4)-monophosphatase